MYNKLFTKILDSSIWMEPLATRIVWVTLIAAMDEDGFVAFASASNVAHRARVTEEEAQQAVATLEGPDSNSSNPDNDGRRIERVPGGWVVINAPIYRELVTREIIKTQTRFRVQKHREKLKANGDVTKGNAPVTLGNVFVTPSVAVAVAATSSNTGVLELQIQEEPKAKPFQPTETQKRLNKLFKRRDSTKWNKYEEAELKAIGPISNEDMATIERYYLAKHPTNGDYRRRDLKTLLNNWNGELDRSRQFKPSTCF